MEQNNAIDNKIKASARDLIFSYGIRGWNMDEFAKEAGITKRTLYKYIDSKEALVEETLISYIRDIQQELGKNLQESHDFLEGLNRIIDVYPSLVIRMDSRVVKDIFNKYPSIENAVVMQKDDFTQEIDAFIQKGKADGVIDVRYDGKMILDTVQALIIYYIKNNPAQLEEKLRDSIAMLAHGFMKKER